MMDWVTGQMVHSKMWKNNGDPLMAHIIKGSLVEKFPVYEVVNRHEKFSQVTVQELVQSSNSSRKTRFRQVTVQSSSSVKL